jgi:hypothetical protein
VEGCLRHGCIIGRYCISGAMLALMGVGDNARSIVASACVVSICVAGMCAASMLLVAVPAVVRLQGNECMLPTVAVLVLGECVLTVIHCNVDISTSGVGELFLCHGGGCAITGSCVGSEDDCVGDMCGCAGTGG